MICKACGAYCQGFFCSHCGAPLGSDAPSVPGTRSQATQAEPLRNDPPAALGIQTQAPQAEPLSSQPPAALDAQVQVPQVEPLRNDTTSALGTQAQAPQAEPLSSQPPAALGAQAQAPQAAPLSNQPSTALGTQAQAPQAAPFGGATAPVPATRPQTAQAAPSAPAEPDEAATPKEEEPEAGFSKRPRVRVKMRQIFFPSLVFFLPLIYLLVDAFVVYNSSLQAGVEGGTVLQLLVKHLVDTSFASNSVYDIIAANVKGDGPVLTFLSVKSILAAPNAMPALVAPAAILAISAAIGAFFGALMLLTAGKILTVRPVAHLAVGGGFFASVAPLLSLLAFRLYYVSNGGVEAADAAMGGFSLSIEVILTCAVSLAIMIPAVRAIRRAAGGRGVLVAPPCSLLGRRFFSIRFFGMAFAIAAIGVSLATMMIELSPDGGLLDVFLDGIVNASYNSVVVTTALMAGDFVAAAGAMIPSLALPVVPLMLLALFPAIFAVLRFLFARPVKVALIKRRQKAFLRTGKKLRRIALIVLVFYTIFGIVTFLMLLLGAYAHINLTNVGETLTLIYLLLLFARSNTALYTTGILVCACAIILANIAGSFGRAFVALSLEKHSKE